MENSTHFQSFTAHFRTLDFEKYRDTVPLNRTLSKALDLIQRSFSQHLESRIAAYGLRRSSNRARGDPPLSIREK